MAHSVTPYIQRRGDIYYFRVAVPAALWPALSRREITYSLRTRDKKQAVQRSRHFITLCEEFFATIEAMPKTITSSELHKLLRQRFDALLKQKTSNLFFAPDEDMTELMWGAREDLSNLTTQLNQAIYKDEEADALTLLGSQDTEQTTPDEAIIREAVKGLRLAEHEVQRIYLAHLEGKTGNVLIPQGMFAPSQALTVEVGNNAGSSTHNQISIDDFISDYCTRMVNDGNWRAVTRSNHENDLRLFAKTIGQDKPLNAITSDDVINYEGLLRKKPKLFGRTPKFKNMSLAQAAKKSKPEECIAPQTASKHYDNIVQLLEDAVRRRLIKENPAPTDLRRKVKVEKKKRVPFSKKQLEKWFGSNDLKKPIDFWLPLLLLYTGGRRSEIAMLRLKDIKFDSETKIHYIRIEEYDSRQLKSKSSKRDIPIHPDLIELGFIDYVKGVKQRGQQEMLFYELSKHKAPSDAAGKRLNRAKKKLKITPSDPKKELLDVHSFRGNFTDALRNADVPEDMRYILSGRTLKGSEKDYGNGYSLSAKMAHIKKITYDLNWDELRKSD